MGIFLVQFVEKLKAQYPVLQAKHADLISPRKAVKIVPLSSHCTSTVKEQIKTLTSSYGRLHGLGGVLTFTIRSAYVKWNGEHDANWVNLTNLPQAEVECQLELIERRGHVDKIVVEFVIINSPKLDWEG
ncbi:hypothetical protein DL766_003327 [Monosporascus sp. MC13-8B]|uniref:Uncharacterized protein n=1 Tax=Monosporascus cannonballus TaxID=155416 RepID=A0ABY0H6Z8_9PEZI|nr:hypothetical protein DL762_004828 [Monosporascus cannonballus]RYO93181.1 hypothetical protein DL763_004453 [Monosporascus cannonballus]RYP33698.1 hypothetical protein DL766_003327 [Monosporascus sp. MC13-8B]